MKLKDSLIIILAVVIAIVVGVFVGVRLTEDKNENPANNNGTTNNDSTNNNEQQTEKDFSLVEAEKLMNKYSYSDFCNPELYIDNLNNESLKNELAIYITVKAREYSCNLVYGDNHSGGMYYNDGYACLSDDEMGMGITSFYKYNDVLESKKLLFGNAETLTKKIFDSANGTIRYEYNSTKNIYVGLQLQGGGACPPTIKNTIESAKVLNDTLKIVVVKKEYNLDDSAMPSMTTVKSETKIQYVFKKQNDNYYLAEINKLN